MKPNKLIRLILFIILYSIVNLFNISYADSPVTIYTPRGSAVSDVYSCTEYDPATIAQVNADFDASYPNATRLADASRTYNCHAYTWYVSEGGSNVWIGYSTSTAEDIFWTDGSYEELNESVATKVSYSGNHSAITTATAGVYISKWGRYPLARHPKNYVPGGYGLPDRFYRRSVDVPLDQSSINTAASTAVSGQTINVSSGTYTISGSVTINSGIKLQFSSGSTITFVNGASLIVNGTFAANGNISSTPITFDFTSPNSSTQNGITFNSGSGGTINLCRILNAYRGIYENGVSINITNSAISGCTNGIYLYNANPTIQGCNIHNNNSYGINMLYSSSSTVIKENYIQNNDCGVYCQNSSTPVIGNNSTEIGNYISGNNHGIIVFNNAIPKIGNGTYGGYNNFVNYTYNVLNTTGNTVYAQNNWWNNDLKIGGPVSYTPTTTQVTIGTPPLNKAAGSSPKVISEDIPMLSELDNAYKLAASNNLAEARKVCLNLVNNYPDLSVSYNALNLLKDTYSDNELTSKKDIYKTLLANKNKKDLYAMAGLILSDIDKENKLKHIDEVINNYKGEAVVELALFDKFVYYYFEMNDKENTLAISKELDALFPLSQGAVEAHRILGDKEYYNISPRLALPKTTNLTPAKYTVLDNYPNPFNPSTNINYSIPEDGKVLVKVYDVLGRELATLVNGVTNAGTHSVVWNGNNFASGIYFYSVTFKNQTLYKKMLLMK